MDSNADLLKLPSPLKERCRIVSANGDGGSRELVLYWMRTAVRSHENPALSAAIAYANRFDLPLLIYHALSHRYQFASDRHHTFILQGARDVQQAFAESGLAYAFHLERRADRSDTLRQLSARAAVVVTEDMPTRPASTFLAALARNADCPIVAVDTACVVPMQVVGQAYTRAFAFRDATRSEYARRLSQTWPELTPPRAFDLRLLPFVPVDLAGASIADLVSQCDIDHTVGPVLDTEGGSQAGYRRWERFRDTKLAKYAQQRNSPLTDGVSRLSAYLHYGMVSPFRIAREAAAQSGEGPEKFLDELLIWRELAYVFCHYRRDHGQWSAIPDWARRTLEAHAQDARPIVYSWEQLARAQTDDALWNAAQRSLLIHGELHNNVRMTWGKSILQWTSSPGQALETMIDLNHRYALDGRDPASYGGLLWCLGQFDRPFTPEQHILGTVRPRQTSEHARRLNILKFAAQTSKSRSSKPPTIAIVGAGVSGSIAARTLADHGLSVQVFEKSHGVGGRMATRRCDTFEFDHGAQYFTARHALFKRYLRSWEQDGVVARWNGRIVSFDRPSGEPQAPWSCRTTMPLDRFVATPAMPALARHLLRDANVVLETTVAAVRATSTGYRLSDSQGADLGRFDRVILAIPAPQAIQLAADHPEMVVKLAEIAFDPCWCAMYGFEQGLDLPWDGAFVNGSSIRWMARNSSKPTRQGKGESIVVHASPDFSKTHFDQPAEGIASELLEEFWRVVGREPQAACWMTAHRWRYSIPSTGVDFCLSNPARTLIACGDWSGGARVEGAFLSGCAAAGQILRTLDRAFEPFGQSLLF